MSEESVASAVPRPCSHQGCETTGPDDWIRRHQAFAHTECPECGRTFSVPALPAHRREHGVGVVLDPTGDNRGRPDRKYRRVRPLSRLLEDLDEQQRLISRLRERLAHAYDVAYGSGSGAGGGGGGRTDIAYSDTTGNTAADQRRQYSRQQLSDAGAHIGAATLGLRLAVSDVTRAVPGSDPYEPVQRYNEKDSPVTPHDRALAEDRQQERIRRGEL